MTAPLPRGPERRRLLLTLKIFAGWLVRASCLSPAYSMRTGRRNASHAPPRASPAKPATRPNGSASRPKRS